VRDSQDFGSIVDTYLDELRKEVEKSETARESTPELSYRPVLDSFLKAIANLIDPNIEVIFEPRSQGKSGRPDWRFYDSKTLGLYGFTEAKAISLESELDLFAFDEQIGKYLALGSKLILTDGIEFAFYEPNAGSPKRLQLLPKPIANWERSEPVGFLETQFRRFFHETGFWKCSEERLMEEAAKRAAALSDTIKDLADLGPGAGLDQAENVTIEALRELKSVLEEHHDPALRTAKVFADFAAQVLIFGLLYAHRIVTGPNDTPLERRKKIQEFWSDSSYSASIDRLRPFRALLEILGDELGSHGPLGVWYQDCLLLLAHIELEQSQRTAPDYHLLYEKFLSAFDPDTRFDFGAFYTPPELVSFAVRLAEAVVGAELNGLSLYQEGNKLIDPCCGTGTFLEELIRHSDSRGGSPEIIGFEILPAPYALAHYRAAMLGSDTVAPKNLSIILTNTLSDELEAPTPPRRPSIPESLFDLLEAEQDAARNFADPPLTLVIGNLPSSDAYTHADGPHFDLINGMVGDFRPPTTHRRGRQNIQRALQNPFVKFLRWAAARLQANTRSGLFALVLPSAFAENQSYRYARKWIVENFPKLWLLDIDPDARAGLAASGVFKTLQGRSLLIGIKSDHESHEPTVRYASIANLARAEKLEKLASDQSYSEMLDMFETIVLDEATYNFRPSGSYDATLYNRFWPLYPNDEAPNADERYVFERHCSGTKLAPTFMFVHPLLPLLRRRCRDIGNATIPVEDLIRDWYSGQDKVPAAKKFSPEVREAIGRVSARNDSFRSYAFRPLMHLPALLSEEALSVLSAQPNSGTRARPEVLSAFRYVDTVGISIAPAPKELGEELHRFVSFCWGTPDNDLCSRGNAQILCNQFPENKPRRGNWNPNPLPNIHPDLVEALARMTGESTSETSTLVVYYAYAVMCSTLFLKTFEAALLRTVDTANRPRIPIPSDAGLFLSIAEKGARLAELENPNNPPPLSGNIARFEEVYGGEFNFTSSKIDEDAETVHLLESRNVVISIGPIPREILGFKVGGYSVLQQWLKFHTHRYTRSAFTKEEYIDLLTLLSRIERQIQIVADLNAEVPALLQRDAPLLEPR
jgi:hypothetical protein